MGEAVHPHDAEPESVPPAPALPGAALPGAAPPGTGEVLLGGETASFRQEWEAVQAGFVDEPRQAVERADKLVARASQRIVELFGREREQLEAQWGRGGDVSTEDLRLALRRYRAFFDRLLSI